MSGLFRFAFGKENRLGVHLYQEVYYTDDEITGCLTLELDEQISCDEIFIQLKGTEHIRYSEETECSKTLPLIDRKIVLPIKMRHLSPGLHRIPFRLAALSGMPCSFKYKHKLRNFQGTIKYKIQAQVSLPGIFQRNLKSEAKIILRQTPRGTAMPSQIVAEAPITTFWCRGNGSVELIAVSDRNVYAPGDEIQLHFSVSPLQSSNRITSVKVSLRRILLFRKKAKAQGGKREKVLARVDAGSVTSIDTFERSVALPIPACKFFTQKSALIECRYEAVFEIKAAWSFTAYVRHSVEIYDSRLPDYSSVDIPEKRIA